MDYLYFTKSTCNEKVIKSQKNVISCFDNVSLKLDVLKLYNPIKNVIGL